MCKKLLVGFLVLMLTGCATMRTQVKKMRDEYLVANPDLSPRLRKVLMNMKIDPRVDDVADDERRLKYIIENEELAEEVKIRILKGNVKIGMSKGQCIASRGEKEWSGHIKPLFDLFTNSSLSADIRDFLQNPKHDWGGLPEDPNISTKLSDDFYEYREIDRGDVYSLLRRLKYIVDNKTLPTKTKIKILKGIIWIEMTKEQAEASWGYLEVLNRSVGNWGTHEQCKWAEFYLYFEDGILASWQEVK